MMMLMLRTHRRLCVAAPRPLGAAERRARCGAEVRSCGARGLASSAQDTAYELLKRDFRRWLGKEVRVLAAMVVVGVVGVRLYQNRDSAPHKQVARLLDQARANAKQEDREAALKNCLQAYTITKSTNAQDRHLFELAFAIAAQFETLGKTRQATRYYLDALNSVPFMRDANERDVGRVVVLDRIAQCYQDQAEQRAAETYYRQAIDAYDKSRSALKPSPSTVSGDSQIDREVAGVLYNYGQQLMQLKRWDEAKRVLQRAQSMITTAQMPHEYRYRIDKLLSAVEEADPTKNNEIEDDHE